MGRVPAPGGPAGVGSALADGASPFARCGASVMPDARTCRSSSATSGALRALL